MEIFDADNEETAVEKALGHTESSTRTWPSKLFLRAISCGTAAAVLLGVVGLASYRYMILWAVDKCLREVSHLRGCVLASLGGWCPHGIQAYGQECFVHATYWLNALFLPITSVVIIAVFWRCYKASLRASETRI